MPFDDAAFHAMASASDAFAENHRRSLREKKTIAEAAGRQLSQAKDAVESVVSELRYFESTLSVAQEARLIVIGGPAGTTIFPTGISPIGPDRLRFEGTDEQGCRVTVMQHVSQLNVMLKAVAVNEDQARRIGFHAS